MFPTYTTAYTDACRKLFLIPIYTPGDNSVAVNNNNNNRRPEDEISESQHVEDFKNEKNIMLQF
jgi:hypothetical protein